MRRECAIRTQNKDYPFSDLISALKLSQPHFSKDNKNRGI